MQQIISDNETAAPDLGESVFTSWDGVQLYYRFWRPAIPSSKALLLLHRGHEHSGRLVEAAERLKRNDRWIFAWDARGHGRSPGKPGYADNFAVLVRDLDAFVRHLREEHGVEEEELAVVANSVAAVIVATWVHDYAPRIRGMALIAPPFSIKLYVPLALPLLRLARKFSGGLFVKSYVRAGMLTHDPEQARLYATDPLIRKEISVNVLVDMDDAARRVIDDAFAISVPTLVLSAGRDWVVRGQPQQQFFDRLGTRHKRMKHYPELFHSLMYEKEREQVFADISAFLDQIEELEPLSRPVAAREHEEWTEREFTRLSQPGVGLKGLFFAVQKLMLNTIGRLSDGVRLGWSSGFDSGQTLNYVYENRGQGRLGIGRLIDRQYLDSIGWRGIRQRREWLEKTLRATIQERLAGGHQPVRIMDLAAGPGRYVQEVANEFAPGEVEALLCDYKKQNLAEGEELARKLGLGNIRFLEADAFDEESIVTRGAPPDIIIISGLMELFPRNAVIIHALRGAARALKPGGVLIYTCQPWHPQLEMIARVLRNREGEPWIMRRRSQLEMDALVEQTGLVKERTCVDDFGIFTVSTARKGLAI